MTTSNRIASRLAMTKPKLIVAMSLVFTWWVAHLLPGFAIRSHISTRLQEARLRIPAIKVDWAIPPEPASAFNASKVALIIEPRPLPLLTPLLLHMITVVPPDWRFVFIGSSSSVFSISRARTIQHQQVVGKLDLMVLPEPWNISSKEMVYRTLTDIRFYDEFLPGVEWILKFESDSVLCSNSPTSLNEWLGWAWAGAPKKPDDQFSGNGGLSLRKVSAIRRVLGFQSRHNNTQPEDEWFGRRLWVLPGEKVTSGMTALAVENVYVEQPMGFHIPDGGSGLPESVWKNANQRMAILQYCPEVSLIMDMKLERERCKGDDHEGTIVESTGVASPRTASPVPSASHAKTAKPSEAAAADSVSASGAPVPTETKEVPKESEKESTSDAGEKNKQDETKGDQETPNQNDHDVQLHDDRR